MGSKIPQFTGGQGIRIGLGGRLKSSKLGVGEQGLGSSLISCSLSVNQGIPAVFSLKVSFGSLGVDLELWKSSLIFYESIFGLVGVDFLALGVDFWPRWVKFWHLSLKFRNLKFDFGLRGSVLGIQHLIFLCKLSVNFGSTGVLFGQREQTLGG